ncbi:MAG: hypothetical protein ACTSU5_08620 [Promethearchaeota archaeon]
MRVRLVIFDIGDTLVYSAEDARAVLDEFPAGAMLDPDTQVEGEGRVRKLFPGVRELFDRLTARGTFISVASLNPADAYKWLGSGFFDLNVRNLHFPVTEEGDSHSDVKGPQTTHCGTRKSCSSTTSSGPTMRLAKSTQASTACFRPPTSMVGC